MKTKRLIALLLCVVLVVSLLCVSAFAATPTTVKQYGSYVSLGDSIGSGFGQPEYNQYNKMVVIDQDIEGSYPSLVADWTGADFTPLCYPGYTSSVLRYELDDSYTMESWEIDQLSNFTFGEYDLDFLDEHKSTFRNAIKNADLITLDIGVNDTWYSAISLVYEIADQGYLSGDERGTLEAELAKYGTWGTVLRNVEYMLLGLAENPTLWAEWTGDLMSMLSNYFTAYAHNYDAIVNAIYDLNPDVTVVALSSNNSFKYLNFTPGQESGSIKVSFADSITSVNLPVIGEFYLPDSLHLTLNPISGTCQTLYDICYEPAREYYTQVYDNYYYVDVDYDCIGNSFTIPLYENSSLDDSGFNPHPTTEAHEYIAEQIVSVLPEKGSSDTTGTTGKFADVSSSAWYASYVDYAVDNGFMTGTSATTFEPEGALTRAMVVTMLYAMDGKPAASGSSSFSDVSSDQWYADPVAWAASNGIVSGYEDGTFRPNTNVSREQLATMLRAYAGYKGKDTTANGDLSQFSDAEYISSYAFDPVAWAVGHGVMSGNDDGTIDPQGETTRAQAATMFTAFNKNVIK